MRYIDPDTEHIIKKRIDQAVNVYRMDPSDQPGQYKKRNVVMHHHHCWMCQTDRHPKRRLLFKLPIDIEE